MAGAITEETWLTARDVASLLGVERTTVAEWIATGKLPAVAEGRAEPVIRARVLIVFLETHGFTIPRRLEGACRFRVLVADDDRAFLRGFERLLRPHAGRVHLVTVDNGHAALAEAQRFRPHLAIVDVVMPPPDGIEVCRRLRVDSLHTRLGVVLTSAAPSSDAAWAARDCGSLGLFRKPLSADVVLRMAAHSIGT